MYKCIPSFSRVGLSYYNTIERPECKTFLENTEFKPPFTLSDKHASYYAYNIHIMDSKYMISCGYSSNFDDSIWFIGLDGSLKNVLPKSGVEGSLAHAKLQWCMLSENHRYLSISTYESVGVIDMETLEIIWGVTCTPSTTAYEYHCADVSNDGTKVFVYDGHDSVLTCYNMADSSILWQVADLLKAAIYYNNATDRVYYYKSGGEMYYLDSTGTQSGLLADHGGNNLLTTRGPYQRSPDGRFISGLGFIFDIETDTWHPNSTSGDTAKLATWLDDRTYGIFYPSPNFVDELVIIEDEFPFKTSTIIPGRQDFISIFSDKNPLVARYGSYEVEINVPNTTSETKFIVEGSSFGHLFYKREIDTSVIQMKIPVPHSHSVDITIKPKPRPMHTADTYYGIGDEIQVLDTNYIYECTTSGTTGFIKPLYPTTGSVTDGTAVFLTKHKIADIVELSHVVPYLGRTL